jgi:ABC-type Fe3+/spermidine/putrescine transport system ATPase subunit
MRLAQGEVVSLLGPSGSGKTTLLRAVAGLEAPHRGTIRIDDRPVFDSAQRVELPAEKRNLGLVFQSYALWPHRTVADNVAYGLKLRNVPCLRVEDARRGCAHQPRPRPSRRPLAAPALGRASSSASRSRARSSTTRPSS